MYEYEEILVEEDGRVGIVTLNHPERMNAWRFTTGYEMRHAIAAFDARDDIRAVIVTGKEAKAMGLANDAGPADQVLPRAKEIANEIADNVAPVSTALTKRMIYQHLLTDDRVGVRQFEQVLFDWALSQDDAKEGFQ